MWLDGDGSPSLQRHGSAYIRVIKRTDRPASSSRQLDFLPSPFLDLPIFSGHTQPARISSQSATSSTLPTMLKDERQPLFVRRFQSRNILFGPFWLNIKSLLDWILDPFYLMANVSFFFWSVLWKQNKINREKKSLLDWKKMSGFY